MTGVLVRALGNEKCFTPQKMADVFDAIFEAIGAIVTEGRGPPPSGKPGNPDRQTREETGLSGGSCGSDDPH